jgi:sterol desaturase/sphingolipid hydroxylase (fatty acid hydroxylase superfamily)
MLHWGIGPLIFANLGFYLPVILLEFVVPASKSGLSYGKLSRDKSLARTREAVPFATQLACAVWEMSGPTAMLNACISAYLLPFVVGRNSTYVWSLSELLSLGCLLQLSMMELVGDFGLYVGHLLLHRVEFLWQFHSMHHKIDTPSPVSTLYIHPIDKTIQGGLPLILAAFVCRPHPAVFSLYVGLRVCENVLNHSGLDAWYVDLLTLKMLPGRAKIAHHDAHHKYGNYRGAKNLGENFWLWDYVFGTYRNPKGKVAVL